MTGTPQPKVAEDGSLTTPSAELKHSGVHQQVAKAVNSAVKVEKEVKLSVESENVEADKDTVAMGDAVPVAMFGDHVEQRHAQNNKAFKDEYDVRLVLIVL